MERHRSVTIRDVARLAGVSVSTVSRGLSQSGLVRPALEARIVDAVTKLGYRPNAAARSLRQSKTRTFGLLFNDLANPGQLDLFKGIGKFAHESGYSLLAADAQGDHSVYLDQIGRFFEQRVEGLFLVSPVDLGDSLTDYRKCGIPVVVLLRKDASSGAAPLVAASEKRAIAQAIESLIMYGHREIAYLFRSWDDRRILEVEEALRSAGLRPSRHSRRFSGPATGEDVQDELRTALRSNDRPTALLVHSTFLRPATEVIEGLGWAMPDDVSLVSVGPSSWHQLVSPHVAAVHTDTQALGSLAGEVMMTCLEGTEPMPVYSELALWAPQGTAGPLQTARPASLARAALL